MTCRGLHCPGCRTTGGGVVAGLVALVVVGVALAFGYRAADSALAGVAASAATTNQIASWVAGTVVLVATVTGAGWVLLARYRTVRDAPVEAAFRARVDDALAAHAQARPVTRLPGAAQAQRVGEGPVRVEAVRCDRLASGGAR